MRESNVNILFRRAILSTACNHRFALYSLTEPETMAL